MNSRLPLRLKHVGMTYEGSPPVTVLHDVNLTLEAGSFSLLLGPSGSGKTTLLGLIGGLEAPSCGLVRAPGDRIGFVFQDFKLIGALSAEENVELVLRLRGVSGRCARRESRAVLDRLGLGALRGKRPCRLSGGEKQRVAIARALVGEPRLILADEPTANLDGATGLEVVDLLREQAHASGVTVLVATHDLRLLPVADRVFQLEDGRLSERPVEPIKRRA